MPQKLLVGCVKLDSSHPGMQATPRRTPPTGATTPTCRQGCTTPPAAREATPHSSKGEGDREAIEEAVRGLSPSKWSSSWVDLNYMLNQHNANGCDNCNSGPSFRFHISWTQTRISGTSSPRAASRRILPGRGLSASFSNGSKNIPSGIQPALAYRWRLPFRYR